MGGALAWGIAPEVRVSLASKNFFSALQASLWSNNKGRGGGGQVPQATPGSATGQGRNVVFLGKIL